LAIISSQYRFRGEAIGRREEATMRIAAARDTLSSLPGSGAIKPMPEAEIARAVQLLDLMLDFLPTTATGRTALMTTETAATALSALFCT
jgi:hypothetical protein